MRGHPCHGWSGQDPRKGSNLGDWKQSVDLRHFQTGPGGGDWGQLGDKVPAPCLPTARGTLLTHCLPVWGLPTPQLLTALQEEKQE